MNYVIPNITWKHTLDIKHLPNIAYILFLAPIVTLTGPDELTIDNNDNPSTVSGTYVCSAQDDKGVMQLTYQLVVSR